MGLIKCPDCGNETSDSAATCPRCGKPIKGLPAPKGEGCFLQTLNAGCMLVVAVVVLIILVLVCSHGH